MGEEKHLCASRQIKFLIMQITEIYRSHSGGRKMSLDEVEAEVRRLAPAGLVEITGGEPLLQEREAVPLRERLLALGYTVLLERVPPAVIKIVDVKCPHSGEFGTFREQNWRS
jgi:7-carboxy-7-deazaguanine synthase